MDEIETIIDTSGVEGEYYLHEKNKWIELNITLNTSKSRVNRLPEQYKGTELRIYVNILNDGSNSGLIECSGRSQKSRVCHEYRLFNKKNWKEVRKIQGEDKGKPYFVTDSCFIRLPKICKDKKVKMYVKTKKPTKKSR